MMISVSCFIQMIATVAQKVGSSRCQSCIDVKKSDSGYFSTSKLPSDDPLISEVVKRSASRVAGLGSIPTFSVGIFRGRVIPVTSKLALQWLPCQAPGAGTGWPNVGILCLGEIESVICNFYLSVAASKLSEQIHP